MKNYLGSILALILLVSCSGDYEYIRFESPQPEGVKPLKTFSKKLKGTYVNCTNSGDIITIFSTYIVNTQEFRMHTHRNDLQFDTIVTINVQNNDELTELLEHDGFSIQIVGDTIDLTKLTTDTVFQITDDMVAKKMSGSYFLNIKEGENHWSVTRMELTRDSLILGQITPSDTLLRFTFVSKQEELNESDSSTTTEYTISPTKREFKQLIKPNSFKRAECYIRIRKH